MAKRGLCLLLALATVLSLAAPALAEEEVAAEEVVTEEPVEEPGEVVEEAIEPVEEPAEEPVVTEEPVEEPEAEPETAATSGTCGDGVTYTLTDDGTLTISGTGKMKDYVSSDRVPWYYKRNSIETVVIGDGVTSIGSYAFDGCSWLASVTIPNSVTSIGDRTFAYTGLTSLILPDGLVSIGDKAFYYSHLSSVTIPASMTTIGKNAFNGSSYLENVTIEDGVKVIGSYAFYNCAFKTITLPVSVSKIEDEAFFGCGSYSFDVTIMNPACEIAPTTYVKLDASKEGKEGEYRGPFPEQSTILGYSGSTAETYAKEFVGHYKFKSINATTPGTGAGATSGTCGEGVTWTLSSDGVLTISGNGKIANSAFSGRSDIKSVVIQNGVTSIGFAAFNACKNLKDVVIQNGVKTIEDSAFALCAGLTEIVIPGSVESLNGFALSGLKTVTISEGVKVIKENAFNECVNLQSVTLPKSLTRVENCAFYLCKKLENVTILNPACELEFKYTDTNGQPCMSDPGFPRNTVICSYLESTACAFAYMYGYTFKELDGSGTTPTNTPKATAAPTLLVPTVTISQVLDDIQVSWNKIAGSLLYTVYYKENNGGWKKIGTTASTTYTRSAKYLKNGATYQFTVRCCAEDKKTMLSGYTASNSITYTVDLAAPTVTISQVSDGIKVSWNKVAGSPRYMVYYKEGNGGWKKIGTTTATTYTRKAANLKNGVTYQFTVRCCANDKKTLLGPYKASNALKYTSQLAAPTVKIAKVAGGIKVTWNKIAGAPRYMVYYKEGNGGWKKIGTTTATSYTRAAKYLKNGVTYAFTVRCCQNDKKTLLGPYKASNSLKYKK